MTEDRAIYKQVAELHFHGINQGFLATLGQSFLALLYEAIDESDGAVLITESKNGIVVGFVSGASSLGPVYRSLLWRFHRLVISLAPVLVSPSKIWRITELLLHNLFPSRSVIGQTKYTLPEFELLSISVLPEERRNRVAKRLYNRLVDYARCHELSGFKIVVGEQLEDAHKFYARMGAAPVARIFVHGKDESMVYVQQVFP